MEGGFLWSGSPSAFANASPDALGIPSRRTISLCRDSETDLTASVQQYWTKLGLLMGRIVSPVIAAVLFYAVVTQLRFCFE